MTGFFRKFFRRFYIVFRFPKGLGNFLLDTLSYYLRADYILGKPVNAIIELTNLCDLKCPVCETGAGILKRKKGMMSLIDYKTVIDRIAPFTNTVLLYYMGEPFLNKDIYEIISYTKARKIFVKICTNGHNIDPVKVIDSGLDEIQFQIGGVSQGTHSVYRVNGGLSKTLENIKALAAEKRKRIKEGRPVNTKIYLGFIIMKHNEQELNDFFKLAGELGVDGARVEAPCVRNIEQGKAFLPRRKEYQLYDMDAFTRGVLKHKDYRVNHCRWMYYSVTVTWEGDVIPCCRDVDAGYVMGNLLRDDISLIWNNRKFREFRQKIINNSESIPMCFLCDGLTFPSLEQVKR